jgi:hypothetical protein
VPDLSETVPNKLAVGEARRVGLWDGEVMEQRFEVKVNLDYKW